VLSLVDSNNIYEIFKKADILPSSNLTFQVTKMRTALQRALGVEKLVIRCMFGKPVNGEMELSETPEKGSVKLISEVRLCYNLDYQPIDCEPSVVVENNCGNDEKTQVHYLPFPRG
jgi:hypothetical protein